MREITVDDWRKYFPFSDVRDEQILAINRVLHSFLNEKKKFTVLEAGTGVGKSAIAVTIARYLAAQRGELHPINGAYILTTQKILQEQYVRDFGQNNRNLIRSIKSSSNYTCSFYTDQSCGESRRILTQLGFEIAGTPFFECCKKNCTYVQDKKKFMDSMLSITNFSYFMSDTQYVDDMIPRQLLVIDECHNIENEVGKHIELTFNVKFAKDVLRVRIPRNNDQRTVFEWVKNSYQPALSKHVASIAKALRKQFDSGTTSFGDLSKQYSLLDKHICKVNRFIEVYDQSNWILNVNEILNKGKKPSTKYEFKPIDVSSHTRDALYRFGDYVLLMSATIVDYDVFCRTVGINKDDAAFIHIKSPFPLESRPVHYIPVGHMSMKNIDQTLPVLAEAVKEILTQHENDKGIVHCVSFKVAQYLANAIKSDRLLMHDSQNRDVVLKYHMDIDKPTVLLSPSMTEGVDLADNASRFQIICKVPYPYLGDKVVKKRMEIDGKWYSFQTAKTIIQALGRSIRNKDDYAVSYILDSDWEFFFKKNAAMFPHEFHQTLMTQK